MSTLTSEETSKAGQLDYVVTNGSRACRFGDMNEALREAYEQSAHFRLPSTIHFDGALFATVVAS